MEYKILKLFIERGFLLDKEMLDFLNELKDEDIANEILNKIAIVSKQKLITKNLINQNFEKIKPILFDLEGDKKRLVEKFFVNVSISVEVKKETIINLPNEKVSENPVKIISSPVLASQKLEVKDFVKHFRNRYVFLKSLLQQKTELENLTSIDKINNNHKNFSIIGIVTNKNTTKNKNLILEVEDLTDRAKLLINQNREEVYNKSKEIMLDDVIGFKCSGTKEFLFVNDLFYPDSFLKEKHRSDEEEYAMFISDIHLGSSNFLRKNFEKFISWLNGDGCDKSQQELLKKIRYIFVVGDTIDGVGIYPGQEKDLVIKDIKEQYVQLAEYYKKIPKHITIIQCAGQHDAVRVAEPQPPVGEDFAEPLHRLKNLYLVSNPSLVEISGKPDKQGIRVLMYHGASMHPVENEIEELRLQRASFNPTKIVKHLLLRRHLAPSHGSMVYIPNKDNDSMLIKEVPDVMVTADLHRTDIDKYHDIMLISCSCWQSVTAFEEKVGNKPDPCKVPILNLKTFAIKILDFSDGEISSKSSDLENSKGAENSINADKSVKEIDCSDIKMKDGGNLNEKEIICKINDKKEGIT
jgi:DNA polymerase II small subunit